MCLLTAAQLLLVTWEIANIVVGTISLSLDYQKRNWHNCLLFLVGDHAMHD